jgi:hypothetical protein
MNPDEWDYLPGSWNVFENSKGWRLLLDVARLPGRWTLEQKQDYAAALLYALNHGQPEAPEAGGPRLRRSPDVHTRYPEPRDV